MMSTLRTLSALLLALTIVGCGDSLPTEDDGSHSVDSISYFTFTLGEEVIRMNLDELTITREENKLFVVGKTEWDWKLYDASYVVTGVILPLEKTNFPMTDVVHNWSESADAWMYTVLDRNGITYRSLEGTVSSEVDRRSGFVHGEFEGLLYGRFNNVVDTLLVTNGSFVVPLPPTN